MGIITNKDGLPQIIVDALKHDTYKVGGDISVTGLIDAPQIRVLKKKHHFELETDVTEMVFALFGTAVHHILERAHINDYRKQAFITVIKTIEDEIKKSSGVTYRDDNLELKNLAKQLIRLVPTFFPEVESRYVWEVTLTYTYKEKTLYGTFDLYDKVDKILFDYKVCSVWAYLYPESRKKWNAQTNTYAFMLRETNPEYEVKEIYIVAIFRDWSASKVDFAKGDYPTKQILTIPIDVVDHERMRRYVESRMALHIEAENGDIPECTGSERWARSSEYAVVLNGRKKALRKFDKKEDANEFMIKNKHLHEKELKVFERPGESKRCESYCAVRDFCPQKKLMDQEENKDSV